MRVVPIPSTAVRLIAAFALAAIAFGCATPGEPPPPDTSQLVAAGFRVIPAKTQQQVEHLQALPPAKLTEWQRTGKHYFVYPDVAKKQLYVGTPKEYEAYVRLVPGARTSLSRQSAADMSAAPSSSSPASRSIVLASLVTIVSSSVASPRDKAYGRKAGVTSGECPTAQSAGVGSSTHERLGAAGARTRTQWPPRARRRRAWRRCC